MEEEYLPVFEQADTKEQPRKSKKKIGTVQVVLVQCICCAVLVLFFWLFKLLGGNAYLQLKEAFEGALKENTLLETVSGLLDEGTMKENAQTDAVDD